MICIEEMIMYCNVSRYKNQNQSQPSINVVNNFKSLLSIKASAGSGKTYNLAKRYIDLLALKGKEIENFYIPNNIDSIIALTFTNKAAEEMRDRIIKFLKGLAGIGENSLGEVGITNDKSKDLLVDILKNFENFNVTTIDSFMNTLHKAFAVDLGVLPDYDITFDSEKIFDEAVAQLFIDKNNENSLIAFLKTLLLLGKDGMNGEDIIKKSLKEYNNLKIENDNKFILSNELESLFKKELNIDDNTDILKDIEDKIKSNADEIKNIIENNNEFNKTKISPYKNINIDKLYDKYTIYKDLTDNNNFRALLKSPIDQAVEKKFFDHLKKILQLYLFYITLKEVKESSSIFEQIKKLKEEEKKLKSKLNIVDGNDLAKAIGEILKGDCGVPYAFCRLGEQIMHYLIDEFQDTSREQYETISPLLENAKGSGGSIFVVGDKKQSIYGWRGGDYTLFDEIENNYLLQTESLQINYRSAKNIVEFNSECFGNILTNIQFNTYLPEDIDEISDEIQKIYKDAKQQNTKNIPGYINIHLKYINNNDQAYDDFYKKRLVGILKKLIERGIKKSDILILVRSNAEIPDVVEWIHSEDEFKDIPFITDGNLRIINNFEIKKILLVASFIVNENDPFFAKAIEELGIKSNIDGKTENLLSYSPYEFFCAIINLLQIKNDIYIKRFLEEVHALSNKNRNIREIIKYFYENEEISITSSEELDAIKVMSIHKAKGLESKVVILPCYDWGLYRNSKIYDSIPLKEIIEGYNEDKNIFVSLNKIFREISKTAKDKYQKNFKAKVIEEINLMYVAHTRAAEELYITGAVKLTKDKSYSKPLQASAILDLMLKEMNSAKKNGVYEIKDGGIFFLLGDPSNIKDGAEVEDSDIKPSEKIYNPYSIVERIRKSFTTEVEIENLKKRQKFGTDIHKILSYIKIIKDENSIDSEIEKAASIANINLKDDIRTLLKDTINNLKDYFIGVDECWNEKEFVTKNGAVFRVDRLIKNGDSFYLIDYKTGNPNDEDIDQVRSYCHLLSFKPEGLIYYLANKEIKNVRTS